MYRIQNIGFLAFILLIVSCNQDKIESTEDYIAKFGNQVLLKDDVQSLIKYHPQKLDSTLLTNQIIANWAKDQLVAQKAKEHLGPKLEKIESQVEAYRRSLLVYQYEKQLVAKNKDTLVSNNEIETYYNKNQNKYTLSESIVESSYFTFPSGFKNENFIDVWLENRTEYLDTLKQYAMQHAIDYSVTPVWMTAKEFLSRFPMKTQHEKNQYLNDNTIAVLNDSLNVFVLDIRAFRKKGTIAPLSKVKNEIEAMLLTQKKQVFIKNIKEKLYNDAIEAGEIQIFE